MQNKKNWQYVKITLNKLQYSTSSLYWETIFQVKRAASLYTIDIEYPRPVRLCFCAEANKRCINELWLYERGSLGFQRNMAFYAVHL